MDQFEMESMVYTQDPIYLKFLNEISSETFSEVQLPVLDIKSKYSEMLQAYYEAHLVFRNEFEALFREKYLSGSSFSFRLWCRGWLTNCPC